MVTTFVDADVDTMIQPVVSQLICQTGSSRHVVAYPWGLPPNFTPQVANRNAFMPYHPFVVHPANGNPWSMTIHSPQMVNVENCKINS